MLTGVDIRPQPNYPFEFAHSGGRAARPTSLGGGRNTTRSTPRRPARAYAGVKHGAATATTTRAHRGCARPAEGDRTALRHRERARARRCELIVTLCQALRHVKMFGDCEVRRHRYFETTRIPGAWCRRMSAFHSLTMGASTATTVRPARLHYARSARPRRATSPPRRSSVWPADAMGMPTAA
jgi:hypothetical protein